MERRSKTRQNEEEEQTVSQDLEDYVYEEKELETTFNDAYAFDAESEFTFFRY